MAIISGMEAAKVDDIKPFELPIDNMAKGIEARQKRADDAKKNFGVGSTSLIFDVRDNPEDKELLNVLGNEYATEIEQELANRGGDWSNMDNSTVQALAMNKLKDPRAIHLRKAKEQADAFAKEKQEREKDGFPLMFGIDATTQSLYDKDGRETNFYDWSVQKQLDYHKKIDDVFNSTAKNSKEWNEFLINNTPSGGTLSKAEIDNLYFNWITTVWNKKGNNHEQMKSLIDNGVNSFITTSPEGTQMWNKEYQIYQRINKDKPEYQANPDKLIEDAETHAYRTIWNTMKAVAGSYMTNEVEQKMNIQTLMKPQTGSPDGGGRASARSGGGDDEIVVPPINSTEPLDVTNEGMFQNISDYGLKYNSIVNTNPAQIKSIVLSANKEGVSTPEGLLQLNNIHAIAKAATLVPGNEIGYDEKGTAVQSKTGLLLQDKGFNVDDKSKNTPYLNSNIAVKGETKYSMNDYAALLQLPNDKLPAYLRTSSPGYGVNPEVVKNIEEGRICFDEVDLRIYYQNKKIKDRNAPNGERNMTSEEINTAINELTGGDSSQKGGVYGSMFDISVNLDSDGFIIDNDNDPNTPEVVTTSITVKNDYSGLINQYDSQLNKLTPDTPLYNAIKAKRDNLKDKRDRTQFKIDMLNAYNIESPSERELRLQEINLAYGDKYSTELVNNQGVFNEFAKNVNKLRKGIEAKALEAANYRGLQLASLVALDVNISAENIKNWANDNTTVNVNTVEGNDKVTTAIPKSKIYDIIFGKASQKDMQTLNNAVRDTELSALDAANGSNLSYNFKRLEPDLSKGSAEEKKKAIAEHQQMMGRINNFYKDLTFQRFDLEIFNKLNIDNKSSWFSRDSVDKYNIIQQMITSPQFRETLKGKYQFTDNELNVLLPSAGGKGGLTDFMQNMFASNIKLDDEQKKTFQYTRPLFEIESTYQTKFNEILPTQIKSQDPSVSTETTRVLQMYYTNLNEIKKDYNMTIPAYRPLVNKDTSDKFGGNTFKQYKTFIAGQLDNLISNYGKPNNPNKIKLVRYDAESGELAKETYDINLLNTQLKDSYNASRGKKPGDDGYDDTYDLRKHLSNDDNFRTIQFAFDGFNDDPTRPLNAIFTLNLRMNGTDKPVQVEMPLSDLPIQLASDMGIPIDKYKLMTPLTQSLQASQGLHFTLPPFAGNTQHSGEELKNGIKYWVVPNIKGLKVGATQLKRGQVLLVESGKSDVSFDDIVSGRAKINLKDPNNPDSGLAIFGSFDEVLSHHMTSGLNPKTVEILSAFDQMRSEFFGVLKGSLANDQFSRKKNYDLLVSRYGKAKVDAWFPSNGVDRSVEGIGESDFRNARRLIQQGLSATPVINLPVNPKSNSSVQGQTAIVEPVSVKDLSKSITFNQDVENFANALLTTEDFVDNQGKPNQKYSLKSDIKQEQLNKMSNNDLVVLLANDKVFKNSKSILDEINKGVIRVDANGNHSNSPNFNPNTAGRYFLNGNSPQYRSPELYNNINTAQGVKPIYSNELHNGVTNINNLFNVVPELKGNKINIGSGARSIEDNIMVYSNQKNLKNLTKSNHSSFNAIDISTNVGNADGNNKLSNGGNKLFDWFKTKDGQRFLYQNGLYIYHHKQAGSSDNTYHMHLEYNLSKAGRITDEADGYIHGNKKTYQYIPTEEEKKQRR